MIAAHQLDDFVHLDIGQVHSGRAVDLDRLSGGRPLLLGRRVGQTLVMERVRPQFWVLIVTPFALGPLRSSGS